MVSLTWLSRARCQASLGCLRVLNERLCVHKRCGGERSCNKQHDGVQIFSLVSLLCLEKEELAEKCYNEFN